VIPEGGTVSFTQENSTVKVVVPAFAMHTGVVLEY
jgi:hypothetical protein